MTGRSESGTSGGALIAPSLRLQLGSIDHDGDRSWRLKGDDWVSIIIRTKGMDYQLIIAYFDNTIGPCGPNLVKLQQISRAVLALGLPFIIVADWNMVPEKLSSTGFLGLTNSEIRLCEHVDHTCISGRMLDYLVVSRCFSPAVKSVRTASFSPWRTHVGMSIVVDRRPRSIHILAMDQPFIIDKDLKLKDKQYRLDWEECKVEKNFKVNDEYRDGLQDVLRGAFPDALKLGQEYANWSKSSEKWLLEANDYSPEQWQHYESLQFRLSSDNYVGRGCLPSFSKRPLEHWSDEHKADGFTTAARAWSCVGTLVIKFVSAKAKRASMNHIWNIVRHLQDSAIEIRDFEAGSIRERFENIHVSNLCCAVEYLEDDAIKILLKTARLRSAEADRKHEAEVRAKVRKWASDALDLSAREGHAYLRKADVTSTAMFGEDRSGDVPIIDPMTSVESRAKKWKGFWTRDDDQFVDTVDKIKQLRIEAVQPEHRLDELTDEEGLDAIKGLRDNRGLGGDWWTPRELKSLPMGAKLELIAHMRRAEELVTVPIQSLINLMALLPKATGGERTVALQAMWHVIWTSARSSGMREWDEAKAQHWDSAVRGASAQKAGLLRRLLDELAVLSGLDSLSIYWDVEKFYDSICIVQLVKLAAGRGFPLHVAAIDLQVHLGLRIIRWAGSHSQPLKVSTSVLAGSKFSNMYARVYLYDVLEKLHAQFDNITIGLHVDDLATSAHGDIEDAMGSIEKVGTILERALKERLLEISHKTVVVSSKPKAASETAIRLAKVGIRCEVERSARDLGVDAAGGSRRSVKVLNARISKTRKRLVKLKVLKKLDKRATKLYATNLWPASTFAIGGMGVAPTSIKKLRTQAGQAALGKFGQCNTTAIALMMRAGADPAIKVRLEVVKQWSQMWRSMDDGTKARVRAVWQKQLPKLQAANRWSHVRGPMRATMASLIDMGWNPVFPDMWYEPEPSDLVWYIQAAGDSSPFYAAVVRNQYRTLWKEAANHHCGSGMGNGVDLSVIKRHLRHFEKHGMNDKYTALLTVAAGASWPRQRKHACGMISTDICPRCNLAVETATHHFWTCPKIREMEEDEIKDSQNMVPPAAAGGANECLWNRGLPPLSQYPEVLPQADVLDHFAVGEMDAFKNAQSFYLDGSGGERTKDARVRRCGWGAVVMDFEDPAAPELVVGCCGGLPGAVQTVPRAEMYAAIFTLENTGSQSIQMYSDCKYFVDGFQKGRSRCIESGNSDLWERFWEAANSKPRIRVSKVKAHAKYEDVRYGRISLNEFAGNTYADKFANQGAAKVQLSPNVLTAFDIVDAVAWKVQSRLVAMICAAPTREADKAEAVLMKAAKAEMRAMPAESSPSSQEAGVMPLVPVPTAPAGNGILRLGGGRSSTLHQTHSLADKRGVVWCWRCGKYATSRGRALLKRCSGAPNATGKQVLARIRRNLTPNSSVEWGEPE